MVTTSEEHSPEHHPVVVEDICMNGDDNLAAHSYPQADQSESINGQTSVISPAPTPGLSFVQRTPLSGYDEFMRSSMGPKDDYDMINSPQYMLDWSQMPTPMGCDPSKNGSDLLMSIPMSFPSSTVMQTIVPDNLHFDPGSFHANENGIHTPPSSSMDGGYHQTGGVLHTPASSLHLSRPNSYSSRNSRDAEIIIAGQDAWSAFKCTPAVQSAACPRTAKFNLEKLEETLRNHDTWMDWGVSGDGSDFTSGDGIAIAPLQEISRDKLLAITQSFLHKALDIHQEDQGFSSPSSDETMTNCSNFVILPPTRILESLLKSYINSFELFYPLTACGILDPNALMLGQNDKASSLLLLLMIGQGAIATSSIDGRWLTGGLTEACRISLFDLIEKNIMLSGDLIVLHSALLFTVQAGWSGDKWQMDIAMGQRGMYFAMLKHSNFLEGPHQVSQILSRGSNIDALWKEWIYYEQRSRYV